MLLEGMFCLAQADPAGLEALRFKAGPSSVRYARLGPRRALPRVPADAGDAAGSGPAADGLACAALGGVAAGLLGLIQSP